MIKMINEKNNAKVAEILGAFTGDGWIQSDEKTFYICGHSVDDKIYYDEYLGPLFSKQFISVNPRMFRYWRVYGISTCNRAVIKRLLNLGFQKGKKCYTATIPEWIKDGDISLQIAFLRGLFDTDGGVWFEKTTVNDIIQIGISIASCSETLINQSGIILSDLGIDFKFRKRLNLSKTRNNSPCFELRVRRKKEVHKWFKIIGTHNPKYQRKYDFWNSRN